MAEPQFGDPAVDRAYRDRPAAFGVLARNGRIAVVRIEKPEHPAWIDLPGGALDPGESEAEALVREFGEETGLGIEAGEPLGRAGQFFVNTDGEALNNLQKFFEARLVAEAPGLKIETDHTLAWIAPLEAIARLRHPSHAWAVALALRAGLLTF